MKDLNLVYKDRSEIDYRHDKFPDGQNQIVIQSTIGDSPVKIISRLNNFVDLEKIICATQSLRELGVEDISLDVPYFLGSRSDRKFESGSNNYIKTVIAPIINSQNYKNVFVMDAHSDVLEACINKLVNTTNLHLVRTFFDLNPDLTPENTILVAPDAGASKKIFKLNDSLPQQFEVIVCGKDRGVDGKINKTVVPNFADNKNLVIIDDICDGGKTFINIADAMEKKTFYGNAKLYLIVTHGIFSNGLDTLSKSFTKIYSSNSYSDIQHDSLKQKNILI